MSLKTDLVEKRGELDAKRKKMAEVFSEAGADYDMTKVKSIDGVDSTAKAEGIRALNAEINDLTKVVTDLADSVKALDDASDDRDRTKDKDDFRHAGGGSDQPDLRNQTKSLGQLFKGSQAFTGKAAAGNVGPLSQLKVENVKTLFATTAGWAPAGASARPSRSAAPAST